MGRWEALKFLWSMRCITKLHELHWFVCVTFSWIDSIVDVVVTLRASVGERNCNQTKALQRAQLIVGSMWQRNLFSVNNIQSVKNMTTFWHGLNIFQGYMYHHDHCHLHHRCWRIHGENLGWRKNDVTEFKSCYNRTQFCFWLFYHALHHNIQCWCSDAHEHFNFDAWNIICWCSLLVITLASILLPITLKNAPSDRFFDRKCWKFFVKISIFAISAPPPPVPIYKGVATVIPI